MQDSRRTPRGRGCEYAFVRAGFLPGCRQWFRWPSDVTCNPMESRFFNLAVIMDWYSRKLLGWRFSNRLDASFCVGALEEAIYPRCTRNIQHRRGMQFTSDDFVGVLKGRESGINLDGIGAWRDDVFVERLWRSMTYEKVYLDADESLPGAHYHCKNTFATAIRTENFRPRRKIQISSKWYLLNRKYPIEPTISIFNALMRSQSFRDFQLSLDPGSRPG